jgi:CrcB protein
MGLATTEPPDRADSSCGRPASEERASMTIVLIAIGGAIGSVLRYAVDTTVSRWAGGAFPVGTLVVNTTGSFILGVLFALAVERSLLPPVVRPALMIGLLGAYTTFSTWMLESWRLLEDGAYLGALANLGGSVVLGLVAVVLGLAVGRAVA